jgi:8-oxo-dGTP pyrophosphatase MutT (NUDIX family)/GNAT superfamily N-acetyltransferase
MVSSGGQWQPDLIGQPDNHPSTDADPRSGGVGGIGGAPVQLRENDLSSRTAGASGELPEGMTIERQQYRKGDDEHTDLDSHLPGWDHYRVCALVPGRREPIGHIEYSVQPQDKQIEIHETQVHSRYQRQGVGTKLNQTIMEWHPHHDVDRGAATEDGEEFRKSLGSTDWCRHRHASHCWLPRNDSTHPDVALYTPQDRGVCPWTTATMQQINCPMSEPGPMAGMSMNGSMTDTPELRWHFTATWADVRAKAKRIRAEGGVVVLSALPDTVTANVQGDTGVYESQINYVPGTRRVGYWQCFLPDAPVTMADGSEKPISEVQPGDMVITHTGAVRRVVRAEAKPYDGGLTRIKVAGDHRELVATSEHEVYAANRDYFLDGRGRDTLYQHTGSTIPSLSPRAEWKGIGTLEIGDYVSRTPLKGENPLSIRVPRPALRPVTAASGVRGVSLHSNAHTGMQYWIFRVTEGGRAGVPHTSYFKTRDEAVSASNVYYAERAYLDVKVDEELAYWLGWYTAEGFLVRKGYRVGFSLSADEVWVTEALDDIAWRKFGVRGTVRHLNNKLDYRISHFALHYLAAQLVGHGAKNKSLSSRLLTLPSAEMERFVRGWLLGDGAVESSGRHGISTVSPTLALQARELLTRQGFSVSISHVDTNPGGLESTRNGGEIFSVRYQSRQHNVAQFHKDGSAWHRVESSTTEHYSGDVWDIEVEGDHSFRAYGYNVHNCGCAWASYTWGRSPAYRRYEGRMCSHALALQFEAQSWEMSGLPVTEDTVRPGWMRDKVRVRHDRVTRDHDVRAASRQDPLDPEGVYPSDHGLCLARPPIYAFAVDAYGQSGDPADAMRVLLAAGLEHTTARELLDDMPRVAAKDEPLDEPTHAGVVLKAHDTGRVLMIQRSHKDEDDPAAGKWEFPGGSREPEDHNSLMSGVREFEEEVGQPFPTGGHVQHVWRSPNGVYQGHVVVVPTEDDIKFHEGRSTVNPDDPDGDDHEQSAWWHPDDARKNPALRDECKSSPWDKIKTASLRTTGSEDKLAEFRRRIADYSAHDALGGDASDYRPKPPPRSPQTDQGDNPGSTGWATSGDPPEWDQASSGASIAPLTSYSGYRPIVGRAQAELLREGGIDDQLFTVAPPVPQRMLDRSEPDMRAVAMEAQRVADREADSRWMADMFLGTLHDEPEAALPSTDGAEETEGERVRSQMSPEIEGIDGDDLTPSDGRTATVSDTVARFQQTAAAQALQGAGTPRGDDMDIAAAARQHLGRKTALKDFSAIERLELISEGRGARARNFPDLDITNTHYADLAAAIAQEQSLDEATDSLFS